MGKTKIVLDLQSDLILNNALIVRPSGIVKSDLPGLVDDINGLTMSITNEASARAAGDQQLSNNLSDLQTYVDTTVDSAITTLTSDLADETAARIAADAGLDGRINDIISNTNAPIIDSFAEVVAQMESMPGVDDSSIVVSENNISLKETVAAPASGVRTFGGLVNVGSEPSLDANFVVLSLVTLGYLTGLVAAETAARIADVDAEEVRAYDAEGVLQSNIDTEKGRIDAILLASDADKDSFAEIVSLINSVDTTNDQVFAGYVLSNDAALAAEISRAQDIESSIIATFSAAISTETAARIADVDAEEARALAAEAALSSDLADLQSYVDTTVDSAISTLTSDLADETSARIADVDAEEARALAAEDAEVVRATAAEAALNATKLDLAGGTMSGNIDMNGRSVSNGSVTNMGNISTTNIRHTDSDSNVTVKTDLTFENYYKITDLAAPTNGGDATNKTYVDAGDATLQSNIDTEKARIDAILGGSTVDLDQFAEVVSFVQSIDLTNDDALLNAVIGIEESISDEVAERQAADSAIENSISSLESNINSELSTLSNSLNTEISDRISAIETVEANIVELTETLDTAILTINDSINGVILDLDAEVTRATAAEGVLQTNIDTEKARIDAILQGSDVDLDQFKEKLRELPNDERRIKRLGYQLSK